MQTVQLATICDFEKGRTGLAKATPGEYPLVATGAERRSCDTYQFDTKAVCIPLVSSTGHGHASLNYVHYQEGKFALGTILVALTAKDENQLDVQFLHLYLSELKDQILVPLMSGAANVSLSIKKIKTVQIPLPSIHRQREIVQRFNTIKNEDEQLKKELSHQQTLLKKLRQQILQEAIEGKLTAEWRAQNPEVEPASNLLERITAEKARLIKEKKIKKQKPLPPITEKEKPFALPKGWEWCRLGEITYGFQYGTSSKSQKTGIIPVLRMGNIQFGKIIWDELVYSSEVEEIEKYKLEEGDLLFNRTNSRELVGKTGIYIGERPSIYAGYIVRFHMAGNINPKYSNFVMNSLLHRNWCNEVKTDAIGQSNINATKLSLFKFTLPPLPEQKVIVTKVEKLLALCDQLETQITGNQTHAEHLMQAVLKEAFNQSAPLEIPRKGPMLDNNACSSSNTDICQAATTGAL